MLARIAIHYGNALYRDGDYYGRDVNIASRVAARAAGGEVLVTRPVVERARGRPRVRQDRRDPPEGIHRVDRGVRRGGAERAMNRRRDDGRARARGGAPGSGAGGGRAAVGRAGLDLPARPRGADRRGGRGERAARELRAAGDGVRRGRAALRGALRAARGRAGGAAAGASRAREPAGVGARGALPGGRGAGRGRGSADVATGHTATDQVETILYRLASSPSRRALLGMRVARGPAGPSAASVHARGHGCVLPGARIELARGPEQRVRCLCAQPGPQRAAARAARDPSRPPRTTCSRWPRSCAGRPTCSTRWSTRCSAPSASVALERAARAAGARCGGLVVQRLADEAAGGFAPGRGTAGR